MPFKKSQWLKERADSGKCINCRNSLDRAGKYCTGCLGRASERNKLARRNLRAEVFEAYGGKCVCCGEHRHEFLSIDHLLGDGYKDKLLGHRGGCNLYARLKKQNYPKDRYRCLCHNCNQSLGFFGYCPHQAPNGGADAL